MHELIQQNPIAEVLNSDDSRSSDAFAPGALGAMAGQMGARSLVERLPESSTERALPLGYRMRR